MHCKQFEYCILIKKKDVLSLCFEFEGRQIV